MERINKPTAVRLEAVEALQQAANETGARDVRRLVEMELMLVGGGEGSPDWGG